jgi:hypothetical protein
MLYRYRALVFVAFLAAGVASAAQAQRGLRVKRPPYSYFKYRIPRISTPLASRLRLHDEIRLRGLERSLDRTDRLRERQFALQDRARTRQLDLQDRVWRRQLEARDRAFGRMHERLDRFPKLRPFMLRRHSRTV